MDPLDAAMMTGESSNPLHVAAVLIMSPPENAGSGYVDEIYRETLSATASLDPRLRRYPHHDLATGGLWVWQPVDSVDMRDHCERLTLSAHSGPEALWQKISELHAAPLDRSRPMWMSYLIDGLDDGRFAFYVKVHHTLVDGVAGLQMIAEGLSTDSHRRSMPAFFAAHHDRPAAVPELSESRSPNPFRFVRELVNAASARAGAVQRLVVGEVQTLVEGLTSDTTVSPLAAPYTRFNGRLGKGRAVAAASWPRDRIRAIQTQAGVTGNDVVVAVVSGVLRRWLLDHDELPRSTLVGVCPITARARGGDSDSEHGNVFGAWLCPLGTDLDDPAERLSLIHRSMTEGKRRVAERGAGLSMLLLAPSIGPTVLSPMLPSFVPRLRTGYNLPISYVPAPRTAMYWNGARVDEIYPVSAVFDGQSLNVTACSYAERICFGYVAGTDVMPDIDTVVPLTEQTITELEAAVAL